MMPWSSSVFSRLPNIMSRMIRRLHLSPTTSSVRLIGQPERWASSMGGIQTCGETPRKDRLQYCTSYLRIQPVAICKRFEGSAMAKLIMWNLMTLDGFVEGHAAVQ